MVIEPFEKTRRNQRSGRGRRSGWERRASEDRRGERYALVDDRIDLGLGSMGISETKNAFLKTKTFYEQPHMDRRNGQERRVIANRRYGARRDINAATSAGDEFPGEVYHFPTIGGKKSY